MNMVNQVKDSISFMALDWNDELQTEGWGNNDNKAAAFKIATKVWWWVSLIYSYFPALHEELVTLDKQNKHTSYISGKENCLLTWIHSRIFPIYSLWYIKHKQLLNFFIFFSYCTLQVVFCFFSILVKKKEIKHHGFLQFICSTGYRDTFVSIQFQAEIAAGI